MTSIEPGAVLNCTTCYGTLTVGGVELLNQYGAWCLPRLDGLWGQPEQLGEDTPMPRRAVRTFPRTDTFTTHQLDFWCSGQVDGQTGLLAYDAGRSPEAQLVVNMQYLRTNVFAPVGSGDGTRAIVWSPPGIAPVSIDGRAILPADGVELLPKAVLRGTVVIEDPQGELHL